MTFTVEPVCDDPHRILHLLFAALLHASWNAIVKASGDKMYAAIGVSGSAALIALVMLPFAPQPALVSAPYLLASCAVTGGVYGLVAKTYQVSDMSQTYPLMRGTAPLLVAAISVLFLGDRLSPLAWLGIGVICLAILAMAFNGRAARARHRAGADQRLLYRRLYAGGRHRRPAGGLGAGLHPVDLFMNGFCLLCWAMVARRREASRYLRQHWKKGILGGIGTMGSYGLALWAMTQAPLAVVAALRETSILFGALIAFIVLKEQLMPLRIVAACGIAAGAILLRLA